MPRDLLPPVSLGRLSDRDAAFQEARDTFDASITGLESFARGIKRENYVSLWANDKINKAAAGVDQPEYQLDPDYRFQDDEANFGYDPSIMIEAGSAEEAAAFRAQIDQEMMDLRIINANAWGTAGQIFGGIANPHVSLSAAVAPYSLTGVIALEGTLEAGSEVLLHNMQKTRTLQESFLNVTLTAAGVGILGGAAKAVGAFRGVPQDVIDDINSGVLPGAAPEGAGGSAGAARTVSKDEVTAEDDRLIGGRAADLFSIGQMAALSKSLSETARMVAGKLADNPLFNRGHAKGKTRGVSVEALHEAAMGRVVIATDKAHAMGLKSGLKADEFERQVGIAMSQGDRHANPQVAAAARMYREEVIGPIQEAASRLGLLETDEGILKKIEMVEEDIQRLIDEGAGPGTTKRTRELEAERAAIISKAQKKTDELTKAVTRLEADLEAARRPLEEGGKARKAPASMMKDYNKARSALTKHQKGVEKKTAAQRQELAYIRAQNKRLKKARKKAKRLKAKQEAGGRIYAESYFPRVYDNEKIYSNWNHIRTMLDNHFKNDPKLANLEPAERLEMVLDTMQNMLGGKAQTVWGKGPKEGRPSALRARSLRLLDKDLEHFLEKRANLAMIKHAQGLQPYIMIREAFGNQSLDDMVQMIRDDYDRLMNPRDPDTGELIEELDPKKLRELTNKMEDDISRIRIMSDRLMHQVQRSVNPQSGVTKAIQYSKLWNLFSMLGGVVLSSLPDIARPIAHYGLRSFGKGLAKGMGQAFSRKGSVSSEQVKRTGAALQRTLNERASQLADSMDPDSKGLMKGQKIWSKITAFDWYTDVMESVAAHTAMDYVVRAAEKVAQTQLSKPIDALSKGERKQIARMGLSEDDLIGIYHESMGTMGAQDTVLKHMNTMQWKDIDLAKRTEAAIGSDVRRTIIRIGVGEKPAFMDDHAYSWLLQFQSFAMSAQNKIMLAGFQNMNRHTAEGLLAMMVLGAGVGATKAWLRGDDVSKWSNEQWVFEGIDRSGMTGILREPFNALRFLAATQGWTDGVPSRYAGRGWERAITPPGATNLGHIGQAVHDSFEGDFEKAGERLWKIAPNPWHIREVLIKMADM